MNNNAKNIFASNNFLDFCLVLRPTEFKIFKVFGPKNRVRHVPYTKIIWIQC